MKKMCILIIAVVASGCAGRSASPVMATQYQDKGLSCEQVGEEMRRIEVEIRSLLPQSDKTRNRVGWGIAGLFFFPLWFAMDLSDAEKIEIDAYKTRYENLRYLAHDKCT